MSVIWDVWLFDFSSSKLLWTVLLSLACIKQSVREMRYSGLSLRVREIWSKSRYECFNLEEIKIRCMLQCFLSIHFKSVCLTVVTYHMLEVGMFSDSEEYKHLAVNTDLKLSQQEKWVDHKICDTNRDKIPFFLNPSWIPHP